MAARLVALCLLVASSAAPAPEWEPLYRHYQLELGDETFSILVIRPEPVHAWLLAKPRGAERERLRSHLLHECAITRVLLHKAAEYVERLYYDRGVFGRDTGERLTGGLGDLRRGLHPIILVTRYIDSFDIFQTVSVGADLGEGLPTEIRLRGRGLEPLPRPERRAGPVPIRFVPKRGALLEDPEVSQFLSRIPRRTGAVAEIKTFTRSRFSRYNFAAVVHRLLVAHGLTLFGGLPIDPKDRLPPLEGADLERARAIEAKYPDIDRRLLYPELQDREIVDTLFLRAGGDGLARLYDRVFAFGSPMLSLPDPDDGDKVSHILGTSRERFETETWKRLEGLPDVRFADLGEVRDNPWGPLACATTLDVRSVKPEHYRRYRRDPNRRHYTFSVRWLSGPPIGADWPK